MKRSRSSVVPHLSGSIPVLLGLLLLGAAPHAQAKVKTGPPSGLFYFETNDQTDPITRECTGGDPVVLSSGSFLLERTDLRIEGRGLDFTFERSYRSGSTLVGPLGRRWDHNWNQMLVLRFQDDYQPPWKGPTDLSRRAAGNFGGAGAGQPGAGSLGSGGQGGPSPPGSGSGGSGPSFPGTTRVPVEALYYFNGHSRVDRFGTDAQGGLVSPAGYFAKVRALGGGPWWSIDWPTGFELRSADGMVQTFGLLEHGNPYVSGIAYRLTRIEDRFGNAIELDYTYLLDPLKPTQKPGYHRLDTVRDTYGRSITFEHEPGFGGALSAVTDFTGRRVEFEVGYSFFGRELRGARTPSASGGLPGTGYPDGKWERYEYTGDALLSSVVFPQEHQNDPANRQAALVNTFDVGGRVVRQDLGGTNASGVVAGGATLFLYEHQPLGQPRDWGWFREGSRTMEIDPNGNAALVLFDENALERLRYDFTGRLDHAQVNPFLGGIEIARLVSIDPANPDPLSDGLQGATPLRPGDPASFVTRKTYDAQGLLTNLHSPGEYVDYVYDSSSADEFQRGNLLETRRYPVDAAGQVDLQAEPIVELRAYEPYFNQLRASWDPRGLASYVPPNGGVATPDRYRSLRLFDYQEAELASGPLAALAARWAIDADQGTALALLAARGVTLAPIQQAGALGDLNGDGVTPEDERSGAVVREDAPLVQVYDDPAAAAPGFTAQLVQRKYRYNTYGLRTWSADPRGEETWMEYYPVADPTGATSPPSAAAEGGRLARALLPEGVVERYEYDLLGRRTRATNGRGFTDSWLYDELDQVILRTDRGGYRTWFAYDWNGNLIERREETWYPELDAQALPTGVELRGPDVVTRYDYDILDRLVEERRDDGGLALTTRYRYDPNGNRVLVLHPEFGSGPLDDPSDVEARSYDERNYVLEVTRGGLGATFRGLAAHASVVGTVTVVDAPVMSTESLSYDYRGLLSVRTDGRGKPWTSAYDGFGRLTRRDDPLGNHTVSAWDPASRRVESWSYDAGNVLLAHSRWRHDELGRVYESEQELFAIGLARPLPDGPLTPGDGWVTSRVSYDSASNPVTRVRDDGVTSSFVHDGLNRLISTYDALGNGTTYEYDAAHNPVRTIETEVDGQGLQTGTYTTRFGYDALDRRTSATDSLGQVSQLRHDSRGNLVFASDPAAVGWGNTIERRYDAVSRRIETRRHLRVGGVGGAPLDPTQAQDGVVLTSIQYDRDGRTKSRIDDNGNPTTYEYDSLWRLTKERWADGEEVAWTYLPTGEPDLQTLPNGYVADHDYDDAGRLISKAITRSGAGLVGTTLESYQYDGLDRLTLGMDDDSTVVRRYDSLGRVLRDLQDGRAVDATYDGVGHLTDLVYPGGRRLRHTFDALGRLDQVQDVTAGSPVVLADYAYEGRGRVVRRDHPVNGTRCEEDYDGLRRPLETRHRVVGQAPFERRSYGWNAASHKAWRHDLLTGVRHDYDHDSTYQMVRSQRSIGGVAVQTQRYDLDGVTNRRSVTGGARPGSYGPLSDPVNEYGSTPFDTRQHDANGNLTALSGTRSAGLTYDYRNQPVSYTDLATGTTTTYRYDVLGRRVAKRVGAAPETRYRYHGWSCVEEGDAGGATLASYVHGRALDELVTMDRGGVRYVYHADDQGDVLALTDPSGQVVERYAYADFGEPLDAASLQPLASSATGNPFLFQGRRWDAESGWFQFRTRSLDPRTGRFTTRDTIGVWGDPFNFGNAYTFAGNDPWSRMDPYGRGWLDSLLEGVAQVGSAAIGAADAVTGGYVSKIGDNINEAIGNPTLEETYRSRPDLKSTHDASETVTVVAVVAVGSTALVKAVVRYGAQRAANESRPSTAETPRAGGGASSGEGLGGKATTGGGKCQGAASEGAPKSSPKFEPPTNRPANPPSGIPPGWRVREMSPTEQYPNGYWKLEKPMKDGSWQPIDPSTMKPGGRPETHIPFPPSGR